MGHKHEISRTVGIDHEISQKEFDRISLIVKNYSLKPVKIEKVRSVYKIITDGRIYCLKRIKPDSYKKAEKGALLSKYLVSRGFYNVIKYVKTDSGSYFVKSRHSVYYLTDWIKGREVSSNDFEELKKCAELLADFHNAAEGFVIEPIKMASKNGKWLDIIHNNMTELSDMKMNIDKKSVKTAFDSQYANLISEFTDSMNVSLGLLEEFRYLDASMKADVSRSVCHDSFYYQNLLVKHNGKVYLIDLDSCVFDICVNDLAKFIRRILYKKKYCWDFSIAKDLILEYTKKRMLCKSDYELLLAMLIYPHKFWKLGMKRYSSKKNWPEHKYLRKLNKIIEMKEKQNKFIAAYLNYFLNTDLEKENAIKKE